MPTIRIKRQPTPLQLRLVQLLIEGKSQKQIALETGRSLSTIKKDLAAARARAGADSLYQLVAVAILVGWCTLEIWPEDRSPLLIVSPRIE